MKADPSSAILICPGDRPGVSALARSVPLVLLPILGKSLLEYWLDYLADRGVRHVYVLATDRPEQVRAWLGEGQRWELQVEVRSEDRELTPAEVRARYGATGPVAPNAGPGEVIQMDYLPGTPERPLFRSYADWFSAVTNWLPRAAAAPDRIGVRATAPGVWVGLHSRVSPDAELRGPCWIGDNVLVGPRAMVGPNAIVESGAVVASDAEVTGSIVGSDTYVGEFTELKHSLASGSTLINWQTRSCTQVLDAFLLSPLGQGTARARNSHWLGRATAAAVLLLTLPLAGYAVLKAWARGQRALRPLVAVRPCSSGNSADSTVLTCHEFSAVNDWLKRWPQLWKVVCGEFAWVGDRPVSLSEAAAPAGDYARLGGPAPLGLFSLADAEKAGPVPDQEERVLGGFRTLRGNRRLDPSLLGRALRLRLFKRILFD